MPPAIGPIIGAVLVVAGVATEIAVVISAVVSIAVSVAMAATAPKPKRTPARPLADSSLRNEAHARTVVVRSSIEPHRIIYGKVLVSGPLLFAATSPANPAILNLVVALAGHECEEIGDVYLNDELTTAARLAGHVTVFKHLGTADQTADADLIAENVGWASTDRLQGIAYIYVRLVYNSNIWLAGVPNVRAVVKGRKPYDPRTGTHYWTANAALCQRDYLRGNFGLAVPTVSLDEESWMAAANICDEWIALAGGGYQRRYECDGTFQLDEQPIDIMEDLLSASAGSLVYAQGTYRCYAGAYNTPTAALGQDDLRAELTYAAKPPQRELFNTVRGTFVDPTKYWQPTEFPAVTNAQYVAEDGQQLVADIELPYTMSSPAAQRIARLHLEKHRQATTVHFPAKLSAIGIVPYDTVTVTLPLLGWAAKIFRVLSSSIVTEGVDLVLQEESPSVYSWAEGETVGDAAPNTALPSPWAVSQPSSVLLQSGRGIYVTSGGSTTYRIRVVCVVTEPSVTSGGWIEAQYKKSADSEWISGGIVSGGIAEIFLSPVEAATLYDVRVRATNDLDASSEWLTVPPHLVSSTILYCSDMMWVAEPSTAAANYQRL